MSDSQMPCKDLYLDDLSEGIPVISKRSAGYFVEACMVCLDSQQHSSGVVLIVKTDQDKPCYNIYWENAVGEQLRRSFGGNHNKTTENGATAIALMLIRELTEYTAIQEAFIGSTVDYFLTSKEEIDDTLIFNNIEAYCEIRGIRQEGKGNTILGALRKKTKRLNTPQDLPTFIVVVEFSQPFCRITVK